EEPGLLNPRVSFEAWKETVRGRSRAWRAAEIDAVHRLRRALVELRQAERLRELNSALRRTLTEKEELVAQKEILMKEAYHRVQNSLQIVNSMLQLQIRETTEPQIRDRFMEASQRILAVSNVHRHLWQSDQIEEVDFGAYLESLVDGLAESWGDDW